MNWKKILIITAIVLIVGFILYKVIKGKPGTDKAGLFEQAKEGIKKIAKDSKELAEAVERIFRLETNHYDSNIFRKTNSAGITKQAASYPWGWNSLKSFWDNNPKHKPKDIYKSSNGFEYLVFPDVYSAQLAVGEIVKYKKKTGRHAGYYYSNKSASADNYLNNKIMKIAESRLSESGVSSVDNNQYLTA